MHGQALGEEVSVVCVCVFLFISADLQAFHKDKLLVVWCHEWGNSPMEAVVAKPISGGGSRLHNGKEIIILRKVCAFLECLNHNFIWLMAWNTHLGQTLKYGTIQGLLCTKRKVIFFLLFLCFCFIEHQLKYQYVPCLDLSAFCSYPIVSKEPPVDSVGASNCLYW